MGFIEYIVGYFGTLGMSNEGIWTARGQTRPVGTKEFRVAGRKA